jgi:hypothetical protein
MAARLKPNIAKVDAAGISVLHRHSRYPAKKERYGNEVLV